MSTLISAGAYQVLRGCDHNSESCECVCDCGHQAWRDHAGEIWGAVCYVTGCPATVCATPPVLPAECGEADDSGAICQRDQLHTGQHAKPINVAKTFFKVWD